jgi:PAS domain S-box-containing protein
MAMGTLVIYLNRKKYYTPATILQLVIINLIVYLFADVDHPYGGVYFYFITCSIAGLILLNYFNLKLGLFFAIVSVLLGVLAYITDFHIIPEPNYDFNSVRINFLFNLTIGTLSTLFVVYFLIKRNAESEKSLRDNESNLIKLSSELKVSEERFAMALEGTKAGIYEWRVTTNSVYVSSRWKKLLGYEEDEIQLVTVDFFLSLVHPDDSVRTSESIQTHIENKTPYQNELRLKIKNGDYKWFQDSGISKTNETGGLQLVIGSIIDIDERKKAEEELALKNQQLQKTNEELDRFVYSASHDMRAPLSSMLGLIFITEHSTNPEETKEMLDKMKGRIKVMEGFIKEVTDYSRNARLEVAWQNLNVYNLVKEIMDSHSYSYRNQKINVSIDVPNHLEVMCDPHRLKVILNNLISNAIKYSDYSKPIQQISISARVEESKWSFTVADNGLGISNEHVSKIFDMFYRASEKSDGSGLGLYILKETLNKLGGSITVDSTLKVGTSFHITLPLPNQQA